MSDPMITHQNIDPATIARNLDEIRARMAAAAQRARRDPASVTLVAVSKTYPFAAVQAALDHGQQHFGENRVEELWQKIVAAEDANVTERIRWHMIGSIQGRKSDQVIGPISLVHSIDRFKIAKRISRDAQDAGTVVPVLIEVNVSGEASKHGFLPSELLAQWVDLVRLEGLHIRGLMTMAPIVDDPELARPVFRDLHALRNEMQAIHRADLPHLSMGMSGDFEVAIEEGATIIRIGTAIFGPRT